MPNEPAVGETAWRHDDIAVEHPGIVLDIASIDENVTEFPRLPHAPSPTEQGTLPDELLGMYYYG
jgi:hypothetical protein